MEQNIYTTIRKIILTRMILVPFIPFVLVLIIGYYFLTTSIETSTVSAMKRIAGDHRHMIESFLEERKKDLEFIGNSFTFQQLSQPAQLHRIFENLSKESNAFIDLGVFNEEGVHIAYHGHYKLTGKIYKNEDWFKAVMQRGYYISDIFLGYRQVPHFVIAVAQEEKGKKWVIRATIDTFMFSDFVKKVRIGKTGEAYLVNSGGLLQTERRSGGNLMDKLEEKIKYPESPGDTSISINAYSKGDQYLYMTTWLKDKQWLLIVRQEKSDAFKDLRSATYLTILIIIIGGGIIVAVAFNLTSRVVRRMERMDVEKDKLSQQLIGASRLAEIGEMSTGFAHEINNPLQIMKSEQALIEMILSELKESGKLEESDSLRELEDSINQITLQISRCAKITQAILKFGRQGEPVPKDINLQKFIPEVIGMVSKKASVHGISIKQIVSDTTPVIHCDPSQLQQVLINLFNNAMDAILERYGTSGGELTVKAGAKDSKRVEILVRDNGGGISPENLKKIFSPFFTTKPVGKGTGLGLSVCYGIIDSMGGTMDAVSEKGAGSTFIIHMPVAV